MSRVTWVWLVIVLIYGSFFAWYTSFGGPLTEQEIDHYMALFEQQGDEFPPESQAMMRRFMTEDTGDDFVMINVIDMYDSPLQIEGITPGEGSEEVLARYMEYMWPALLSRASHPVLVGTAASPALDLMNAPGMESWTSGAGMRYRSRRDMLEIATNPAFQGAHNFKVAAMRKTIAFPVDPWFHLGDPRLLLALLLATFGFALSWLLSRS